MMKRVRKLDPGPTTRAAVGQTQWALLLKKAIARAQMKGDPRLGVLQQALMSGTAERILRKMSIICDADLQREFPESQM